MPLTDEQTAALLALKEADPKEVADALKADANDHYNAIFRIGYGTRKGEEAEKLEEKDAEIKRLQSERDTQEEELKTLREGMPDLEAERAKYEKRLQEKDEEATAKVEAAEARVRETFKAKFQSDLKAALIAEKIDPDYAGEVLTKKYEGRIEISDDGAVKVLAEDGLTPLQAADGELASVFAKKIKAGVDPKWIVSASDGGGGADSTEKGATDTSSWDKMRKDVQKSSEAPHKAESDARRKKLLGEPA